MSCLPRGFPTQRVFIKKTLRYGLCLVANSHNIQVWVYSEGHRQSFIEECIVRDLAWLLSNHSYALRACTNSEYHLWCCNNVQLVHS